jgi:phosphohistidine phosphatase
MKLLVVRHAVAKDKEAFAKTGADDGERPLTKPGRREFKKGARGIARIVGAVDVVATSPLVRAAETARILAAALGTEGPITRTELEPGGSARALIAWLGRQGRTKTVAIVGHEPDLSRLVARLATGQESDCIEFDKGGACLLSFEGPALSGCARVRWLLTAAQLRKLDR